MEGLDLSQLTDEQLAAALKKRNEAKKAEQEAMRKEYEKDREALIGSLCAEADELSEWIKNFHSESLQRLLAFRERTKEYGGVRSNSKGGYSLESKDGQWKVSLEYRRIMGFDERIVLAEDLIKDFMGDTVKKNSKNLYGLLMGFLEKNKEGKLEPARVMELLAHEDKFEDERWKKAIALIKESYSQKDSKYYMNFARKSESGKWENVNLSFSSL